MEDTRQSPALPYWIKGTIGRGEQRGRTLGVPTANVQPDNGMPPVDRGVYAAYLRRERDTLPAVASVGSALTFKETEERVEVFCLDWSGDLYDTRVSVELVAYIRPLYKFADETVLQEAMNKDIQQARTILE